MADFVMIRGESKRNHLYDEDAAQEYDVYHDEHNNWIISGPGTCGIIWVTPMN